MENNTGSASYVNPLVDKLNEFEDVKNDSKPYGWADFLLSGSLGIVFIILGFLYINMRNDFGNKKEYFTAAIYLIAGSLHIGILITKIYVHHNFLRKPKNKNQ